MSERHITFVCRDNLRVALTLNQVRGSGLLSEMFSHDFAHTTDDVQMSQLSLTELEDAVGVLANLRNTSELPESLDARAKLCVAVVPIRGDTVYDQLVVARAALAAADFLEMLDVVSLLHAFINHTLNNVCTVDELVNMWISPNAFVALTHVEQHAVFARLLCEINFE